MFIKQFQNGKYSYNYCKFIADTKEDVAKIPVRLDGSMMGCEVYVITTGETYILDSGKTWHTATGEKIECGCKDFVQESTIWTPVPSVE